MKSCNMSTIIVILTYINNEIEIMKKNKSMILVGFRVTKEFKKRMDIAAIREERTFQAFATRAIKQYLGVK